MLSDVLSPVFFAPCIASHQAAVEPGDFEAGLYYGLLLHPSLAFLDTSFFLIPALRQHVKESRKHGDSWLEVALKRGAIIPFVRKDVSRFIDIADILLDDRFTGVSAKQKDFVDSISPCVYRMQRWPSKDKYNFGHELAQRVRSTFLNDVVPISKQLPNEVAGQIEEFWAKTRKWRRMWIPKAIDFREKIGGGGLGLRLTDVINVAAKDLLGNHQENVQTASELLKAAKRVLNKEETLYLKALFILLDEQYLRNFCEGMNSCDIPLGLTRPRWHPVISIFDPPPTSEEKEAPKLMQQGHTLEGVRVRLPSLNTLKDTPGYVLKSIWDEGENYFAALEQWRSNPRSKERTELLAERMASYCHMIMKKTKADKYFLDYKIGVVSLSDIVTFLGTIGGIMATSSINMHEPAQSTAGAAAGFISSCVLLKPVLRRMGHVSTYVRFEDGISFGGGSSQITQSGSFFLPRLKVSLRAGEA